MYQWTRERNVIIFHETVVEVGMKLLGRRKPSTQFRGVVLGNQFADRNLQRIVIPVFPSPLLGYRHNGMGRSAPQFLRALQHVPGAKLMVGVVEKIPCCLSVLLNLHIRLAAFVYGSG